LQRGPNGVILTNVTDAQDTAKALIDDYASGALHRGTRSCGGGEAIRESLQAQSKPLVSFKDWQRIDAAEVSRGAATGKVREKFVSVEAMLEAAAE
jgi:NADPH-dependent glutamate synthase beta subunit-like oxidoreductase